MFTNTTPVGAYRGAGRPEGNYYMERLIDTAAREMGIDRVELRRRNHIAPEQMPYKAPSGMNYDFGEFTTVLDKALAAADWDGFDERKAESAARGKLRGRGIGHYLEVTGPPGKEMGGIRFEADGTVTMLSGTLDYGQGHATPFAQVLGEQARHSVRALPPAAGRFSDQLKVGGGTGGSQSALVAQPGLPRGRRQADRAGQADRRARARGRGRRHRVRARPLHHRRHRPRRRHPRAGRAGCAAALKLPPDVPQSLDVSHISDNPPFSFPNGCHVAEVEIDPDTGMIEVVRYFMVNDFGTVINPMLAEGQAHGGVVQGIGQALMERTVYDRAGPAVTGSYMDYAMPRASDAPDFSIENHPVPCKTNLLGVKGCGEAGCAGALPSVMNAVVDALVGGRRHPHRHAGDAGEGVAGAERLIATVIRRSMRLMRQAAVRSLRALGAL